MSTLYVRKNASGNGVFSTLEAARDAVRARIAEGLTEPVTVLVEAGEYRTSGIVFDARDSGTADCPVTYAAEDGEVLFNGGMTLDGKAFEKKHPGSFEGIVRKAPLPKMTNRIGLPPRRRRDN